MLEGGNAVDSAIATMYCNTVVNSQSMGIGGSDSIVIINIAINIMVIIPGIGGSGRRS